MNKSIVLIRFSSRNFGNCKAIADKIRDYYQTKKVLDFTVDANTVEPCSNCDYECLTPGKTCPNLDDVQKTIMEAICNADLTYFIVPNYCGYPCANYFAFNERTVGYFNGDRELMKKYMSVPKRFIIVSNTEGDNFANAMKQQVNGEPEMLYLKTGKYKKRSTAGDMMESDDAQTDLKAFLDRDATY